jgi:putative effector of murein hydrolase LrgA (UPF0299 family)
MEFYKDEYERIKAINDEYPPFVDWDHVRNDIIPGVVVSMAIVTAVFIVAIASMRRIAPESEAKVIYKSAYQMTNLFVNAALGVIGIYYFNYFLDHNTLVETRVLGYKAVFPMASAQFGYNLWAIPVGITMVNEAPVMIGHHVSVLVVAAVSSLFTTGHSWYAPFMYGILEISSVPLAIMNAFKDNPKYIERYPLAYTAIRYVFALTFLYIRWYLYLPLKYDFLRTFAFAAITHRSPISGALMGVGWLASFFLCVLQLYWGLLIIQGIVKSIFGKPKKAKKT